MVAAANMIHITRKRLIQPATKKIPAGRRTIRERLGNCLPRCREGDDSKLITTLSGHLIVSASSQQRTSHSCVVASLDLLGILFLTSNNNESVNDSPVRPPIPYRCVPIYSPGQVQGVTAG